jgi:hypothetical protein
MKEFVPAAKKLVLQQQENGLIPICWNQSQKAAIVVLK